MRNKLILCVLLIVIALGASACCRFCSTPNNKKVAIVLQADTDRHEGMARVLHALLYSKELKEGGYDVALIFDGAGTAWVEKLEDPANKLNPLFVSLKNSGITEVVCDFCAGAFKVKDKIKDSGLPLVSEYQGHPSLKKWIDQGYQIIIL
ncbi:MAG: DsrE family protein [Elusimicrobia bacterium]|nr:DsrE family protein [Elusimicrobiota bacterium]